MQELGNFPKGNIYAIINKSLDQALRIKETDPKNYEQSRIVPAPLNPQDNGQLFKIEKKGTQKDDYEIINLISNLVFSEESKQIRLEFGKQKSSQLFQIVKAPVPGFFQYYWIKTSQKGDQAVYLQGFLKFGKFDPNAQNQLFRFEQVKNNQTIQESVVIINKQSGKALDVPAATFKKDTRIIQYEANRNFNQRWKLIRLEKGFIIQSVLNKLVLDIAGQSRQDEAKIIQWDRTNHPNQQWIFEQASPGVYIIRSIHEEDLCLAIKNDSIEDGGKLEVTNKKRPSMYWVIEGTIPY